MNYGEMRMAKKSRQISLCMNSYEIAARMSNFSAWVRKKLLEEERPKRVKKYWCMDCMEYHREDEIQAGCKRLI